MSEYDPKDLIEMDPCQCADMLMEALKPFNPSLHTGAEDDFDWLEDSEEKCIVIPNPDGDNIEIALQANWTLYFRGWHGHYWSYLSGYEELLKDINDIIANKVAVFSITENDKPKGGGMMWRDEDTSEKVRERLKSQFTTNLDKASCRVKVYVRYWDKSLNHFYEF